MTGDTAPESGCRPLRYSVADDDSCDPKYREALHMTITEVLGTSAVVAPGEKYIIRGEYEASGPDVVSIGVVVSGRSVGHHEDLPPGSGSFELWAQVLDLRPDASPRHLALLTGSPEDRECGGLRVSIQIED